VLQERVPEECGGVEEGRVPPRRRWRGEPLMEPRQYLACASGVPGVGAARCLEELVHCCRATPSSPLKALQAPQTAAPTAASCHDVYPTSAVSCPDGCRRRPSRTHGAVLSMVVLEGKEWLRPGLDLAVVDKVE
jgi:hypothetical protein